MSGAQLHFGSVPVYVGTLQHTLALVLYKMLPFTFPQHHSSKFAQLDFIIVTKLVVHFSNFFLQIL